MGNNNATRKPARRAATFLAALGVLLLSSGVALMATATSANAVDNDNNKKVVVCKYVSTPGGELDHIVVVADNTLPANFNGHFPFEWTDAQGQSTVGSIAIRYALEGPPPEQAGTISASECRQTPPPPPPTAAAGNVTFVDPTCTVAASATPVVTTGVSYALTSGTVAAGQHVVYTETALAGYVLSNGPTFEHTFGPAATDCGTTSVSPPVVVDVSPPAVHHTTKATVTPTLVHAGLAGASTSDLRGEQGLALMFAGMVLLLGAGGLGLRSKTSRI